MVLDDVLMSILNKLQPQRAQVATNPLVYAGGCGCTGNCGQSCYGGCESGCTGNCGRSCSGNMS